MTRSGPLRRIVAAFTPQKVGGPAAPLEELSYVQGEPITLGKGKVSIVEFWATWCPPCKVAIPHLNKLYVEKYKKAGVQLVGVTKEDEKTVKPFIESMKSSFTYPVALDSSGSVSSGYPTNGIPSAFVVDHEGSVAWQGHPMDGGFETAVDTCIENAKATKGSGDKKVADKKEAGDKKVD